MRMLQTTFCHILPPPPPPNVPPLYAPNIPPLYVPNIPPLYAPNIHPLYALMHLLSVPPLYPLSMPPTYPLSMRQAVLAHSSYENTTKKKERQNTALRALLEHSWSILQPTFALDRRERAGGVVIGRGGGGGGERERVTERQIAKERESKSAKGRDKFIEDGIAEGRVGALDAKSHSTCYERARFQYCHAPHQQP